MNPQSLLPEQHRRASLSEADTDGQNSTRQLLSTSSCLGTRIRPGGFQTQGKDDKTSVQVALYQKYLDGMMSTAYEMLINKRLKKKVRYLPTVSEALGFSGTRQAGRKVVSPGLPNPRVVAWPSCWRLFGWIQPIPRR